MKTLHCQSRLQDNLYIILTGTPGRSDIVQLKLNEQQQAQPLTYTL